MDWFIEFLAKYWLTILFGLIAAWLGKKLNHYKQLLDKEKEDQKKKESDNLIADVKKYVDETFKETEESHKKLYKAVLDVQQKQFQRDCQEYLNLDRELSLEEFKNLYTDYDIYTSLGGNGIGSMLFEKVEEKYSNQLFSEKILEAAVTKAQELNAAAVQQTPTPPSPQPRTIFVPVPPEMIPKGKVNPNMIPKDENKNDQHT